MDLFASMVEALCLKTHHAFLDVAIASKPSTWKPLRWSLGPLLSWACSIAALQFYLLLVGFHLKLFFVKGPTCFDTRPRFTFHRYEPYRPSTLPASLARILFQSRTCLKKTLVLSTWLLLGTILHLCLLWCSGKPPLTVTAKNVFFPNS